MSNSSLRACAQCFRDLSDIIRPIKTKTTNLPHPVSSFVQLTLSGQGYIRRQHTPLQSPILCRVLPQQLLG